MSFSINPTTVIQEVVDPQVKQWDDFIEKLHKRSTGVPKPFEPVQTLATKLLKPNTNGNILDIGCETGKNAVPLIEAGHKVTLLDISPKAIRYSQENLKKLGLENGIADSITGKIEELDPKYGSFEAVIGTYAFSFIPPDLFDNVMKDNVLGRVKENGYFVGGFFGDQHSWAKDPELSIMTVEKIKTLLSSAGFKVCEINEKKEETPTVFDGKQTFHTFEVIAQRNFMQV